MAKKTSKVNKANNKVQKTECLTGEVCLTFRFFMRTLRCAFIPD